jgi:hypothetical protein
MYLLFLDRPRSEPIVLFQNPEDIIKIIFNKYRTITQIFNRFVEIILVIQKTKIDIAKLEQSKKAKNKAIQGDKQINKNGTTKF